MGLRCDAGRLYRVVGTGVALWLAFLAASSTGALAVPANPAGTVVLEQPDGSRFAARQFGDEWYHGLETVSGYTVLKDRPSGEWRIAVQRGGGGLIPGPVPASEAPVEPAGLHLRDPAKVRRAASMRTRHATARVSRGRPGAPPDQLFKQSAVGKQPLLVILAGFRDRGSLGTTPARWSKHFFGASGSVRDYFLRSSYGQLALDPARERHRTVNDGVVGWLELPRNHPGDKPADAVPDAIRAASRYVDFASYDRDGDGYVSAAELRLAVIFAGYATDSGCLDGPGFWAYQWELGKNSPRVDGVTVAGGGTWGTKGNFINYSEIECSNDPDTGLPDPQMTTIGTAVHELGHSLGLPDLYNTAEDRTMAGIWSVMDTGPYGAADGHRAGTDPTGLDAWSRSYLGWSDPVKASGHRELGTASRSPDIVRLGENPFGVEWTHLLRSGEGEYFLAENRRPVGVDAALPSCGLLLWHVNETLAPENEANSGPAPHLVSVMRADNDGSSWDAEGAPFLGRDFNDDTTPSSRYFSGDRSGLAVSGIPATCAPTMPGTFTNHPLAPPANDSFGAALTLKGSRVTRPGDDTTDATGEAGEPTHAGSPGSHSVWYRWLSKKAGKVTISTEGSGFDTTLSVYTGSAIDRLTRVAANDDILRPVNLQSRVTFRARAKRTYRIAVDGHAGPGGTASGRVYLNLSPAATGPCRKARRQLEGSKKRVGKARRVLKKARAPRKKSRARRSLRNAKRNLRKAKAAVRARCA